MRTLNAKIPGLGVTNIHLFKESDETLDFFTGELERLKNIKHLGVTSSVFSGLNHSRLDYLYALLAGIQIIAGLNKNSSKINLSNKVKISSSGLQVSSGEELLKSWAILANSGHLYHTYAEEQAALRLCQSSASFRLWMLNKSIPKDLRNWSKDVIDNANYQSFHLAVTAKLISNGNPYCRKKAICFKMLNALVLPLSLLTPNNHESTAKIARLRKLYHRLRIICIAAIDSHYSHSPIKVNISEALMGLPNLFHEAEMNTDFDTALINVNSWLGTLLYEHPTAITAQAIHSREAHKWMQREWGKADTENQKKGFLKTILRSGAIHVPNSKGIQHILRIQIKDVRNPVLGKRSLLQISEQMEKAICQKNRTFLSIGRDFIHNRSLYYDFLWYTNTSLRNACKLFGNIGPWLIRGIEADAKSATRNEESEDYRILIYHRQMNQRIEAERSQFDSIFISLMDLILPDGNYIEVSNYGMRSEGFKTIPFFVDSTGSKFGPVHEIHTLRSDLQRSPGQTSSAHEIDCLIRFWKPKALAQTLQIICPHKMIVRDELGRSIDEWDGVVVCLSSSRLRVSIIEAKSGSGISTQSNLAFNQLSDTVKLFPRDRASWIRRRKRINGGACLDLRLALYPERNNPSKQSGNIL